MKTVLESLYAACGETFSPGAKTQMNTTVTLTEEQIAFLLSAVRSELKDGGTDEPEIANLYRLLNCADRVIFDVPHNWGSIPCPFAD